MADTPTDRHHDNGKPDLLTCPASILRPDTRNRRGKENVMPLRWWSDLKTTDFDTIDGDATVAMVPLAATEQHGPHLPLDTDSAIMRGLIETLAGQVPQTVDVRVLPIQAIGASTEHQRFYGTLTIHPGLLMGVLAQLGDAIAATGIAKVIFVTSHGGNEPVMAEAALDLRSRHNMLAVKTSWQRFGQPDGLFSKDEWRHGIHGGDYETSLMAHFRPDLVDMTRAQNFASTTTAAREAFTHLAPQSPHGFAWMAGDLNPSGVVGNAAAATAEKGRAVAAHQAAGMAQLLDDVRKAKREDWLAF
jgi:creatinine amidohydrolase